MWAGPVVGRHWTRRTRSGWPRWMSTCSTPSETIRAAVPHMKGRHDPSIVIVSSISGWKPGPRAQYGAAKAAEIFLASALAWDLAADEIRVNTVCPGSIMFPGSGWEDYRASDPTGLCEVHGERASVEATGHRRRGRGRDRIPLLIQVTLDQWCDGPGRRGPEPSIGQVVQLSRVESQDEIDSRIGPSV